MLGLIGFPLTHSFSKQFFQEKFEKENIENFQYELFPLSRIDELPELIRSQKNLCGLNVTIPYKQSVIPFLNTLDESATRSGAVNTIAIKHSGDSFHLKGFNTDIIGFEKSLVPLLKPFHTKALVLGNGGAAKAVCYVLNRLNISAQIVSRKKSAATIGYDELQKNILSENKLIINTSPVGMYPNIDEAPAIPYHFLGTEHLLYDLIYNPEESTFLKRGKAQGASVKNGLEMLQIQAEEAWKIWSESVDF